MGPLKPLAKFAAYPAKIAFAPSLRSIDVKQCHAL
eukprot:gene20013-14586_t